MPADLPGFYYDPVKNRYFSLANLPGFYRKPVTPPRTPIWPDSPPTQVPSKPKKDFSISKLLHYRELYGKGSFQEGCKKKLASKPKIWIYNDVMKGADCSLAQMHVTVETPEGQCASDALLACGSNATLSLFDIGNIGHCFSDDVMFSPDYVLPGIDEMDPYQTHKDIWRYGSSLSLSSRVSSISTPKKDYSGGSNGSSTLRSALITTLGSERSGGELRILNLAEPVDTNSSLGSIRGLHYLVSLDCTIWGAEISHCGRRAVVGTNHGATLVDLESRALSTLCRSRSDVLSVQLIQSGNIALCGLRNGAIITVDVRQRQSQRPLTIHRIPHPSSFSSRPAQQKERFVVKGNIQPSCTFYMPSSICCLKSLQMDDQYFLASSMDGSLNLYDHRLTKRGPIQSYAGHVNSHSRIQLATDASERFLISGGQDCKVRIWSIKSGKMLFEEELMDDVSTSVCWQGSPGISGRESSEEPLYELTHNWEAWLGSADGLLRMQFCL